VQVSEAEMEAGLCRAGLDPPPTLVRTLFDAIDENASYKIGFAELQVACPTSLPLLVAA